MNKITKLCQTLVEFTWNTPYILIVSGFSYWTRFRWSFRSNVANYHDTIDQLWCDIIYKCSITLNYNTWDAICNSWKKRSIIVKAELARNILFSVSDRSWTMASSDDDWDDIEYYCIVAMGKQSTKEVSTFCLAPLSTLMYRNGAKQKVMCTHEWLTEHIKLLRKRDPVATATTIRRMTPSKIDAGRMECTSCETDNDFP